MPIYLFVFIQSSFRHVVQFASFIYFCFLFLFFHSNFTFYFTFYLIFVFVSRSHFFIYWWCLQINFICKAAYCFEEQHLLEHFGCFGAGNLRHFIPTSHLIDVFIHFYLLFFFFLHFYRCVSFRFVQTSVLQYISIVPHVDCAPRKLLFCVFCANFPSGFTIQLLPFPMLPNVLQLFDISQTNAVSLFWNDRIIEIMLNAKT